MLLTWSSVGSTREQNGHWKSEKMTMVTGASRLPQTGSSLVTGTGDSSSLHVGLPFAEMSGFACDAPRRSTKASTPPPTTKSTTSAAAAATHLIHPLSVDDGISYPGIGASCGCCGGRGCGACCCGCCGCCCACAGGGTGAIGAIGAYEGTRGGGWLALTAPVDRSAVAIACAVRQRSSFFHASARSTISARWGGAAGNTVRRSGAGCVAARTFTISGVSAA